MAMGVCSNNQHASFRLEETPLFNANVFWQQPMALFVCVVSNGKVRVWKMQCLNRCYQRNSDCVVFIKWAFVVSFEMDFHSFQDIYTKWFVLTEIYLMVLCAGFSLVKSLHRFLSALLFVRLLRIDKSTLCVSEELFKYWSGFGII